jgi:hypothetical protein
MSALLERSTTTTPREPIAAPAPAAPAAPARPARPPLDLADLAGNPVAAAHSRRASRPDRDIDTGRLGRILVFAVVVPTILFLVSNPVGWLLLLLACIGAGALTGIGGIF